MQTQSQQQETTLTFGTILTEDGIELDLDDLFKCHERAERRKSPLPYVGYDDCILLGDDGVPVEEVPLTDTDILASAQLPPPLPKRMRPRRSLAEHKRLREGRKKAMRSWQTHAELKRLKDEQRRVCVAEAVVRAKANVLERAEAERLKKEATLMKPAVPQPLFLIDEKYFIAEQEQLIDVPGISLLDDINSARWFKTTCQVTLAVAAMLVISAFFRTAANAQAPEPNDRPAEINSAE